MNTFAGVFGEHDPAAELRAMGVEPAWVDGDVVFAVATGRKPLADPLLDLARIGAAAADCLARAVARGVYEATSLPGGLPSWRDKFGA